MQFDRLRLNGFKSFVDSTELVIRPGLTGVVGPNGCGKSNLLEALRWVMGENRPKAMRGGGMDDVIFAGTTRRGARGYAEVALTLDNTGRRMSAPFNDTDTVEVTRRITRDTGSVFRVNGREVRARDVAMMFADAATGSASPALVRQGQIAELINAKPRARRKILEDAAGIGGLYQRRHEAQLRLDAAAANLGRVDETLNSLKNRAAALARQAQAAASYREIGARLRRAELAALWTRWHVAHEAHDAARAVFNDAARDCAVAEAAAKQAEAARQSVDEAMPALTEEDTVARELLARAQLRLSQLENETTAAEANIRALQARRDQIDRDLDRERALTDDAGGVLAALDREEAALLAELQGHDAKLAAARENAATATEGLPALTAELAQLTDDVARLSARHAASAELIAGLDRRAAHAHQASLQARDRARHAAQEGEAATAALEVARQEYARAEADAASAAAALSDAEKQRAATEAADADARARHQTCAAELQMLDARITNLTELVARVQNSGPSALDALSVTPGYETALGAALADDLRHPLLKGDETSGWRALPPLPLAPLPGGVTSLAQHVNAPSPLARRLAAIGLVEAPELQDMLALQSALAPGQRLVSLTGDVWRWDGLTLSAEATKSAATMHLMTVNELADLSASRSAVAERAAIAQKAAQAAGDAHKQALQTHREAGQAQRAAEAALTKSGRNTARLDADLIRLTSAADTARTEAERYAGEHADARAQREVAMAEASKLGDLGARRAALEEARAVADAARDQLAARRRDADAIARTGVEQRDRLSRIDATREGWRARRAEAGSRQAELEQRRERTDAELRQATDDTTECQTQRAVLSAHLEREAARANASQTALNAGRARQSGAQDSERRLAQAASTARETRAREMARMEAAAARLEAARDQLTEASDQPTEALRDALCDVIPKDGAAGLSSLEDQITKLRRARDHLGAVNLRADEDRDALRLEHDHIAREKADLDQAISTLRNGIHSLNREGRVRLQDAFDKVDQNFRSLFSHLFGGGEARLQLVASDDPLEAGLEILCQPPGKKLATLSLLSGGEQTLTAMALIFAVFLANPAPICVLDEVDAPLDDANVTRFCDLLDEMARRTQTRFLVITHHAVTMARMDRLFGVTMVEQGVSQLVSVDLADAEALVA